MSECCTLIEARQSYLLIVSGIVTAGAIMLKTPKKQNAQEDQQFTSDDFMRALKKASRKISPETNDPRKTAKGGRGIAQGNPQNVPPHLEMEKAFVR